MTTRLSIGEFSRLTFLSVKALRHYHEVGVLEPATVDRSTGYRSYSTEQVPVAQLIRRLRELDMPIDDVRQVVAAPGREHRDGLIRDHLDRLERELAHTKQAVDALRSLLQEHRPVALRHRDEPAQLVLARHGRSSLGESEEWVRNAILDMLRTLRRAGVRPTGPPGALVPAGLFEDGEADLTAFVPVAARDARLAVDGATFVVLPAVRVAVLTHEGPYGQVCHTYGALGSLVAERGEGAEGPTREYFTVTHRDTYDPARLRTEVCWPVREVIGARR